MGEPRWVRVAGGEVPVLELGDRGGHPVVLLAGLTDGLAPVTDPWTRAVLSSAPVPMARYRGLAVSYRVPVAGGSGTDAGRISTAALAADAAAVLEQLLDGPAVLVCHSMGGMVAQHLAADRPELVAGMVLSATVAAADAVLRRVVGSWVDLVRAGDGRGFAQAAVEASFTGRERTRRLAAIAGSPPPPIGPSVAERFSVLAAACATHDARTRLGAVEQPTLVLAGSHDPVARVERAGELAAALPAARFEVFEGLAHGFPEQAPERFEAAALEHLREIGW